MAGSSSSASGRIFINYRRQDTAYAAGWLFERISARYGDDQIFKDVDSIELGDDFVEVIAAAVGSCDVLLALIGKDWLTITGADGKPRVDDPQDFVRLEIEAALDRGILVIPVLVDGAHMPHADQMPASLARLAHRQALELSPARFDADTNRLLKVLDQAVTDAQAVTPRSGDTPAPPRAGTLRGQGPRRLSRRALVVGGVVAAALVLVPLLTVLFAFGSGGRSEATAASLNKIVFQDHFGNRAGGWDDVGTRRNGGHYVKSAYRLYSKWTPNHWSESGFPRNAAAVFPEAPRDVRINVVARRLKGGQNLGYGIVCRADSGALPYYQFMIWSDRVAIEKLLPDAPYYRQLAQGNLAAVRQNGTNRLQAVCITDRARHARLAFSVNGRQVASVTDAAGRGGPPLATGSVGLVVANGEGSKAIEAEFDDFVVAGA